MIWSESGSCVSHVREVTSEECVEFPKWYSDLLVEDCAFINWFTCDVEVYPARRLAIFLGV